MRPSLRTTADSRGLNEHKERLREFKDRQKKKEKRAQWEATRAQDEASADPHSVQQPNKRWKEECKLGPGRRFLRQKGAGCRFWHPPAQRQRVAMERGNVNVMSHHQRPPPPPFFPGQARPPQQRMQRGRPPHGQDPRHGHPLAMAHHMHQVHQMTGQPTVQACGPPPPPQQADEDKRTQVEPQVIQWAKEVEEMNMSLGKEAVNMAHARAHGTKESTLQRMRALGKRVKGAANDMGSEMKRTLRWSARRVQPTNTKLNVACVKHLHAINAMQAHASSTKPDSEHTKRMTPVDSGATMSTWGGSPDEPH